MKKIVLILASAGLFATAACTEFLKETPRSTRGSEDFYQNAEDATSNVNSLYRGGVQGRITSFGSAYVGSYASIDQMLTGYWWNDYEGQEVTCAYARNLERQQHTQAVSEAYSEGVWPACYDMINVANSAIKFIPAVPMDPTRRATLVAEAKFFRAFNYLYLVKAFGDVPLIVEPYRSLVGSEVERSSSAKVYGLIESDLREAVKVLPAKAFSKNGHRVSKYVAAMALTETLMRQKKYAAAADTVRIVISAPDHSLTANDDMAMKSAFNKLRTTDDLPESIWAKEYLDGISQTDWLPSYSLWQGNNSVIDGSFSITQKVFGPKDRFLNVYKADDLRVQPNQFFHWSWTNPKNGLTASADDQKGEAHGEAGIWYYLQEKAMEGGMNKADKDWNFYRYAEALLYGAEAIAASVGVNDEAAGYLAQVKARAYMSGKSIEAYKTELMVLSKEAFIEECWNERLREFPVEYKMWDDITRTGMFPDISATEKGKIVWKPLVGAVNGRGKTFTESDLHWPISLAELQRNGKLTQNPGYASK